MAEPLLSVVIPAFNEERRIGRTIAEVADYLSRQSYASELIVVNDGSTDRTASILSVEAGRNPLIQVVNFEVNRGKGQAVRRGMVLATGAYRLFMDADNSTTIDHVEKVLPLFEQGCDVVIGSRSIAGADILVHQPKYKEFLGKLGNLLIQAVAVPGVWDTQAGFKCLTARATMNVFPRLTIDGWGFDVELLAVARSFDFKIKEVPIRWVNDPFTHVRPSAYLHVLHEILRVRMNLLAGRYGKPW